MDNTYITFDLCTTSDYKPLHVEVYLDSQLCFSSSEFLGSKSIQINMPTDQAEHVLSIKLLNKTHDHTLIDESGNISQDTRLAINNIKFDQIALGYNILNLAEYLYDDLSTHKFYGEMGCNGVVSLKFPTPVYRWILDHM